MDRTEIDSMKAELRRMQARVEELERAGEEPVNRRNMLRGLGAAAAGAAVGGLAFARPAAADGGFGLSGNVINTVTSQTALVAHSTNYNNEDNWGLFHLTDDPTDTNALTAVSLLTVNATGTEGFVTGASIIGQTTALKLDAPVPLKMADTAAPSQGAGTRGQFKQDDGDLWFCVSSTGSQRWRRIAGPTGAGGFNALTPGRVYDSRAASPFQGVLGAGANRLISVAHKRDAAGVIIQSDFVPADAKAVSVNLTITDTINGGFLAVNPGGNTSSETSAINWYASGQKAANNIIVPVNTSRQLTVVCGSGSGGNTHFILDINGYYL